ncbi:hypothetical protein [Pedobacter sp. Hv1]|uniref:hypothetical protein n=1 Tax=Pedobacter sp. Hv1 TaxID=1740090 RepID=UPI0006D8C6CF|nr:hypothetical protein [Pedobacter sp. Hv1]KQC02070.1 hypothetical protein AQF98_00410 [Pedobacter sp. Hv1]
MENLEVSKDQIRKDYEAGDAKTKAILVKIFGQSTFDKNIMEKVFSMETALEYNGETMEQFIERTKDMDPFDWAIACQRAFAFAMNEHVHLTTEDTWYYPYYRRSGFRFSFSVWTVSHSRTGAYVGSRLCVNSSEKAVHMDKCIGHIIKVLLSGEHTPETLLLQHPSKSIKS